MFISLHNIENLSIIIANEKFNNDHYMFVRHGDQFRAT